MGVDKTPYSRVVQAVKFNADGTGTWWKAVFAADDASKPLALFGGRYLENGTFDYSVAADGTISAKRRGEKGQDGSPMTLVFHYQDGAITFGDGGAAQTMQPAPKDYDNLLLALENSMQGAEADTYNINDKDFKVDQWRQQEAIYIYDGVSMAPARGHLHLRRCEQGRQGRKWQRGLCKCQPALVQRNGDQQPADGFLRRHNA